MAPGAYRSGYRGGYRSGYSSGFPGRGGQAKPPSSGLAAWFKADKGVAQLAGKVTAWADQSGNGNDVAQANGSLQPTFNASSINGLPGITCVNSILTRSSSPLATGTTPRSVFVVCKSTNNGGGNLLCLGQGGGWFGPAAIDFGADSPVLLTAAGFSTTAVPDTTAYKQIPLVAEYFWDGNTADPLVLNFNATSIPVTGALPGADSSDFLSIGNYENSGPGAVPYDGDLCEILIYDHVLSGGDLAQVRGYLQSRYAIVLT